MADKGVVGLLRIDISALIALTRSPNKAPWPERRAAIEKHFPSTHKGALNWVKAFADPHVLGMAHQDILKVDGAQPGRDGPRPSVSQDDGLPRLHQLWGDDYSYLPFPEALQALQASRKLSVRGLAAKVGINYGMVFKFLKGTASPDIETIVRIATAFRKAPEYFFEFRVAVLQAAMELEMVGTPELSVKLYRELVG